MFALAVPGLAPLVRRELPGVTACGFDGRSDVILFEAAAAPTIRTAEDFFAEVGRTSRAHGDRPRWIARRLWHPSRVELGDRTTFRVIVRVLQERSFLRTELRRHMTETILESNPRWKVSDPAAAEFWVVEYRAGRFVAGLRLSDASVRQHGGRRAERAGALRPTVAAAMVGLAGDSPGRLLDPCCGSGTILAEAVAAGWAAIGRDIDPAAVAASRRNVPGANVETGDARRLTLAAGAVDAYVSNLPFGRQYVVSEPMNIWLEAVFAELARVVRPGGRAVLLAPDIPRSAPADALRFRERHPIRLLGTKTSIWRYDRI